MCNFRMQRRIRSGVASLEFVLMLPVILSFILFLLWIYQMRSAGLRVGLDAESRAVELAVFGQTIHGLHAARSIDFDDSEALTQLVSAFDSQVSAGSGWVSSRSIEYTGDGVKGVIESAGNVSDSHALLTNSFSSEVLRFPQSRADQLPLTLPSEILGIAPGLSGFQQFSTLLGF